jgi:DNA-binding response OmpR family regulator
LQWNVITLDGGGVCDSAGTDPAGEPAAVRVVVPQGNPMPPPSILIVDDEPAILQPLVLALEDEGFSVRTATNGRAAMELHERAAADLVLSDVMMPVLDGLGFVAELRRQGDRTPVILMSAATIGERRHDGISHLTKPFHLEELLALVHEVLARG